jgi:Ca2+-binding EF-hand superfamily protein
MFHRLTTALILAAIPAAVMAQAPAPSEDKPITRAQISERLDTDYADLDADKNGKVDTAEINARLKKGAEADLEVIKKERDAAFAKFDTDNDGSITRAEFEAHAKLPTVREPDAKPFLNRFDANKDGAISKDEFRNPTLSNFKKLDTNNDGTLSVAEQSAATATASKAPVRKATAKDTPPIGR